MQILNFCCNHHYCYKVRGGSIDKFCPSRKLLICLLSFPTWISIPIPNTRLTRFLPSTITRFWDRITFCIVPVSPTSLPAITITCKKSPSHKAAGPWKMQRKPDCIPWIMHPAGCSNQQPSSGYIQKQQETGNGRIATSSTNRYLVTS